MDFTLLGPVVVRHQGRDIAITSAQQRSLLAMLLLDAGQVISVDRLIDVLWHEGKAPRTARNVLQACVTRLRHVLEADSSIRLAHKAPGYVMQVDKDRIDLHRFRALVLVARDIGSDDGERAQVLRRALELWRGEPLADADAPGLAVVRQALVEERLTVLEDCLAVEVECGRHAEAALELRTMLTAHPLRERLAWLLMLALYRSGRQGDALEHYQHIRQRLAEELGTDPGPALQELHQRILTGDSALTTSPAKAPRPTAVPRQLPAPPAAFVGRDEELKHLHCALDASGEATAVVISALAGSGGIGKTWLALHWAHRNADRFPDGQLFVDLRGFSPTDDPVDPAVAVRGFLDALGIDPGRIPTELDAQAALYRSLVSGKRMLIVLDNAATSDQVVPLLPGTSTCTVLVTGRRKLASLIDRYGARHLTLGVLDRDEARALLTARLGADRVAAEPAAVDELVALCGGYPLALAITARTAATRPAIPLTEIAAELRDIGLEALDHDHDAAGLPAVLSWSLRHLTDRQRTVFALLGIAPGPDISLAAAASLTGMPETQTRKALLALEDASLIDRRPHGRYAMHDLIRRHAAGTAHDLPEQARQAALERVVDFYLHTAYAAERHLFSHSMPIRLDPPASGCTPYPLPDHPAALAWLDAHHPHLLTAQHTAAVHHRHQTVWKLAWSLSTFHTRRGHRQDELAVWQAATDAAEHLSDPATRVRAHRRLGHAHAELGQHEQAIEHLHRALTLAHDDPTELAHTHRMLAWAWERWGDDQRALEHARHALAHFRTVGQPVWQAIALNQVGWHAARLGDYDTAREHCQAALALHRQHNNPNGEAATQDSLGYIDHHTGHHHQAIHHYHQVLALRRTLGDTTEVANTLNHLGHPHSALGHHEQAREVWREALELYREQGRDTDAQRVQRQLDDLDNTTNH